LEQTITKDILRDELFAGRRPVVELLYNQYSGMLFSYILQFIPDRGEAGNLLVDVFSRVVPQLQRLFDSSLSIYCWLQVESRKIILSHLREKEGVARISRQDADAGYYFSLLAEASSEHRWVFREVFINGLDKEGVAVRAGKDIAYVSGVMRECLLLIRKNLG